MAHLHILKQKLDVLEIQEIKISLYIVTGIYFHKHIMYFTILSLLRQRLRITK